MNKIIKKYLKIYIEILLLTIILLIGEWNGINSNYIIYGLLVILFIKSTIEAILYTPKESFEYKLWLVPIECLILLIIGTLSFIFPYFLFEELWIILGIVMIIINIILNK